MSIGHIIWCGIVGAIAAAIVRYGMHPGPTFHFKFALLAGLLGAFATGFVGTKIKAADEGQQVHPIGFGLSLVGAIAFVLVYKFIAH